LQKSDDHVPHRLNSLKMKFIINSLSIFLCILFLPLCQLHAANYYINAAEGNDGNKGTDPAQAWKSAAPLASVTLRAGDSVLFAKGQTYTGMLSLLDARGEPGRPIVITTYQGQAGSGRPVLDAGKDLYALWIRNSSYITVNGLAFTAATPYTGSPAQNLMRCGIMVEIAGNETFRQIELTDLVIHDVFFNPAGFTRSAAETKTANGTQNYGWGIRFINNSSSGRLTGVTVRDTEIFNVSHTGLKFTAATNGIVDVKIFRLNVHDTGGPGIQLSGVSNAHIHHNTVSRSGSVKDSRNWGRGSGLWTWGCSNIVIEHNRFEYANGPGDSAGVHIDYNCSDVIIQYNFSLHNAGGFCEILGNNYNCAYRYNISVNDGYRIKGRNGAFQEGKVFWLSGYQGNGKKNNGPFNSYFYNNTVYVDSTIIPRISISSSAEGVLIANNVFYFQKPAIAVTGDQKKNEDASVDVSNVVFTNNLYLPAGSWPESLNLKDAVPFRGDPLFTRNGGAAMADYTPLNVTLVKDRGVLPKPVPGDSVGLRIGLAVKQDILGNPIIGLPDLGAIEQEALKQKK